MFFDDWCALGVEYQSFYVDILETTPFDDIFFIDDSVELPFLGVAEPINQALLDAGAMFFGEDVHSKSFLHDLGL